MKIKREASDPARRLPRPLRPMADVVTRFGSTFDTLQRVLFLRYYLDNYCATYAADAAWRLGAAEFITICQLLGILAKVCDSFGLLALPLSSASRPLGHPCRLIVKRIVVCRSVTPWSSSNPRRARFTLRTWW